MDNPEISFQLNEHRNQFLVPFHELPAEGITANVTEKKQKAENLLKEMMGENEVGTAGGRVVTWKSMAQERLDSKTLKAA